MCSLRGVQLVVPDIREVLWEPSIINAFENADVKYSELTLDPDACFEKDTVVVDELLDRLKHVSEADRTSVISQHLLASIGEPELFKRCKSVFAVCRVPGLSNGPSRQHHVQKGNDQPLELIMSRLGHWLISKRAPRLTRFRRLTW
jgi:hypothetical protein